jgi:hypothetical protein
MDDVVDRHSVGSGRPQRPSVGGLGDSAATVAAGFGD